MVAEDDTHQQPDNTEMILDSFLQNNEQTFDNFTSQFTFLEASEFTNSPSSNNSPQVSNDFPESDGSNLGSMLSYLTHRENIIIAGGEDDSDSTLENDMRGLVSSLTLENLPDMSVVGHRSASGCLDMMMNYLRDREMTLETSPEYSIDINTNASVVFEEEDLILPSNLDNRLTLSDSNSNCSGCSVSSSVPDNDRGARLQDLQLSREAQLETLPMLRNTASSSTEISSLADEMQSISIDSYDEVLETIELPSEDGDSCRSETKVPKVDNFISSNDYYDSDKDIDESELRSDDENEPYIPSFFDDKQSNADAFSFLPSTLGGNPIKLPTPPESLKAPIRDTDLDSEHSSNPSFHDCYQDFVTPLPGEFIEETIPAVVNHIRVTRQGSNNFLLEYTADDFQECEEEPDNDVHPFQLDEGFDYDNITLTPKPSPFR